MAETNYCTVDGQIVGETTSEELTLGKRAAREGVTLWQGYGNMVFNN